MVPYADQEQQREAGRSDGYLTGLQVSFQVYGNDARRSYNNDTIIVTHIGRQCQVYAPT